MTSSFVILGALAVMCDSIQSPRVARLCADAPRNGQAESSFWKEVNGHVPLLELIPPRNVGDGWATFVWRGDDSTTAVELDASLPPARNARYAEGTRPLTHLSGTRL